MKFTLILVVACLLVALIDDGLAGAMAEALSFGLMLFIVIKFGQQRKNASRFMLRRVKPEHYDKVL
jgi:hypothetical protein